MNPSYDWRMGTYTYAKSKNVTFQSVATKTATFNSSSQNDARLWKQLIIATIITSTSGSSPTLVLTLQGSHDNSTWVSLDSMAFDQITADGQYCFVVKGPFKHKYLRLNGVMGGGTPSMSVNIEGWVVGGNIT